MTHPLLTHLLDYAGLFPPASLPLDAAIRNFTSYLDEAEAPMLARFIISARRLPELTALAEYFPPALTIAALGRGGGTREACLAGLDADLAEIEIFRQTHGPRVQVDAFETALPAGELDFQIRADTLIHATADALHRAGLTLFAETPPSELWQERAARLITALSRTAIPMAGFKLRTGGVEAHQFPSPETVAWAISACRDSAVPLKCTAGLHHPIRHYNASVQTKMHGFLNVFGAAILAEAHNLTPAELIPILTDEESANFTLDDDGFGWKHLRATNQQIAVSRRAAVSFGTCSFDEPREDLMALGLL